MKILIELPEAEYNLIMKSDKTAFADASSKEAMMYAIKNGVPLPKEHGECTSQPWCGRYERRNDG